MKKVFFVAGAHYVPAECDNNVVIGGNLYIPTDGSSEIFKEKFDSRDDAVRFICDKLNTQFTSFSTPWTPDDIMDGISVTAKSGEWMRFEIGEYTV